MAISLCGHPYCRNPSVTGSSLCSEHGGKPRSSRFIKPLVNRQRLQMEYARAEWRAFSKLWLDQHPRCQKCGMKASVVHHLLPADLMILKFDRFVLDERFYESRCQGCNKIGMNEDSERRAEFLELRKLR